MPKEEKKKRNKETRFTNRFIANLDDSQAERLNNFVAAEYGELTKIDGGAARMILMKLLTIAGY